MAATQPAFPIGSFAAPTAISSITAGTGLSGGTITTSGTISLSTTAGGVGTYAFMRCGNNGAMGFGSTTAGSNLRTSSMIYSGAFPSGCSSVPAFAADLNGGAPSGTWQLMGNMPNPGGTVNSGNPVGLFMRIA